MTYDDLIQYYRSDTAAGRAIGVGRQRVRAWKRTGNVPLRMQIEYERVTGGNLCADISKDERRVLANTSVAA